ncbi:MAG: hypothetical protein ACYCTB_01350 [bacterium]
MAYSLVNRNGMRFYFRTFPLRGNDFERIYRFTLNQTSYSTSEQGAGMTLRGFIVSPVGCHSPAQKLCRGRLCVGRNPVLLILKEISITVSCHSRVGGNPELLIIEISLIVSIEGLRNIN